MKARKQSSKYFIIALVSVITIGGALAQVTIPTGLTNAIQYIRETLWTSDGSNAGTTNVRIRTGGVYVRTGFLADGTGWNNKALGVDASGNVVYVYANGLNAPIFNLLGDYIPKLNNAGDNLELSVIYQDNGLLGINTINPVKSVDILGDFQVQTTQGSNVQYDYTYFNSNTGLGYPAVDITTSPICVVCDLNPNSADCNGGTFTAPIDYGPYCIDATSQVNGNFYNHNVYFRQIVGIPEPVLVTSGTNVGIGTSNPITDLHVSGSGYALIETGTITKQLSILDDTIGFQLPMGGLSFVDYSGIKKLTLSTLGTNTTPDILINPNRGCMLYLFGNCVWYINPPKVGIGLNNPSEMLEVKGNIKINVGSLYITSDENLKENETPITNALGKLANIEGIYYTWKQEENSTETENMIEYEPSMRGSLDLMNQASNSNPVKSRPIGQQIGFLAQDIQAAFPEVPGIVKLDNDGVLGVNYIALIPVLVQAIKEQQVLIEELQADVTALQQQ